jgi:hypothetical protein
MHADLSLFPLIAGRDVVAWKVEGSREFSGHLEHWRSIAVSEQRLFLRRLCHLARSPSRLDARGVKDSVTP